MTGKHFCVLTRLVSSVNFQMACIQSRFSDTSRDRRSAPDLHTQPERSYILSATSFSTAMVSMEIMLPSAYFNSTQAVSILNSQDSKWFTVLISLQLSFLTNNLS